jgi:hypothetical protein
MMTSKQRNGETKAKWERREKKEDRKRNWGKQKTAKWRLGKKKVGAMKENEERQRAKHGRNQREVKRGRQTRTKSEKQGNSKKKKVTKAEKESDQK